MCDSSCGGIVYGPIKTYPSAETHFKPLDYWVYELAYDMRKEAAE